MKIPKQKIAKTKLIWLRVSPEIHERIVKLAKENDVSLSWCVTYLVKKSLKIK